MAPQHIDLYKAFGLDPAASSEELGGKLADAFAAADPADGRLREQLDTAHRILSDPRKRASYDAQLADASAPLIDPARLSQLASADVGDAPATIPSGQTFAAPRSTAAAKGSALTSVRVLSVTAAVLAVVVAVVAALIFTSGSDEASDDVAQTAPVGSTPGQSRSAGPSDSASPAPQQPVAPVEGAYLGAGGPRPAGATPLPTYVSKYSKVTSAHLLTPTGGIGCDFQQAGSTGSQGQCGVRSMNNANSPLGTVNRAGSVKGKWLFQLANDRVGAPIDSSSTTGWMNQPANDGYQVPRVDYGKTYYFENWVVASEMNGLTLWNTATGSGVFLSNEKAETFDGPGSPTPTQRNGGDETIVLGSMPSNGKGYGTEKPVEVFAGGSPTSRIYDITWSSWGGPTAEGTGTGTYRVDGRVGREQYIPAKILVSELGMCDGKRAYRRIAWYFPTAGETSSGDRSMKTCWSER